jgi:leucyl aminopeptidase
VDEASGGALGRLVESGDIQTGLGKCQMFHEIAGVKAKRLLVVGLGEAEKLDLPRLDRACRAAGKLLRNHVVATAHLCLHQAPIEGCNEAQRLRQAALAVYRANYLYTTTKPLKDDSPAPLQSATFQGGDGLQKALDQAAAIGAGFAKACELGDLPANICNPAYLAQEAGRIANHDDRVSLEVLEEDTMAELGMDALLGVSRGSANDAKLIILKYTGAGDDSRPIVLVGKGITFDTGGLSMKSPENMMQMKYDMCGAAGVMGAFLACVRMGLPLNVICVVAAVENMPDGDAYRPGDVLTSMSGQTIEVLNTDAEGRLVLCDALTYCERFEPDAIIDVATLTGACVIALGHHATGLMSNDDDLAHELQEAGSRIVDRAWRLPIWEEYQAQLDTVFADMKNVGGMPAGVLTAGCFLSRFAEKQRWAHLDVAGSAWEWGKNEGASGRPVGLLAEYLIGKAGD